MKRYRFTIGLAAAAFTLSLAPLWAQERSRPADSPSVGNAVPRDSGSSSGSSSSSGSGGSSTTSSSGSSSTPDHSSGWTGNNGHEAARRAPVNPERDAYGDQRRGGGGTAVGRAVPRGEAGGGSGDASTVSTRSAEGVDRQPAPGRSGLAVPAYSRPRDGRPPVGSAVERPDGYYRDGYPYYYTTFIYDPYYSYYYDPYYRSRYYWNPWGYGFGFGYMAYDPFMFGGFGYPGYYGSYYDPYYGGSYYGGGGSSSSSSQVYHGAGSLRLKVKPGNAQVFVDGYFVGTVDSFDGVFQRLNVEAGSHKIELRADGYETTQFDVMVIPNDTITYEGKLIRRK
jgi:PEGA domain